MIQSMGVGSGLDLDSLVQQIVTAERQPVANRLNRHEARYKMELSALGNFKGALSGLQSAVEGLTESGAMSSGRSAKSSSTETFGASAESKAVAGSYSVEVRSLATAAKLASDPFTDSQTAVGTGQLTLALGDASFSLNIDSGDNTLAGIRDAINAAENNTGISATIINESGGSRLVLTGQDTGAENTITVTASGGDGGLDSLVHDPSGSGTTNLTVIESATDAHVRVEGFDHYSASNSVSGVIDHVTLDLEKADAGNTHVLTISENLGSARGRLDEFIDKYNTLIEVTNKLTAYDPESNQAGPLQGDSGVRGVMSQIRSIISGQVGQIAGQRDSLAVFGITTAANGQLEVDKETLDGMLEARPDALASLLSSEQGIGTGLDSYLGSVLGSGNLLASRQDGLTDRLDQIADDRVRLDERMAQVEARYIKQFSAMDSLVAQLSQTSSFLEQQLANMPLAQKKR